MLGSLITTAVLIVGIDVQWPPTEDGTAVECHIQVERQLLESLKSGEVISSDVPPYVTKPIRAFKISVSESSPPSSTFNSSETIPGGDVTADWSATNFPPPATGATDTTVLQLPGTAAAANPYGSTEIRGSSLGADGESTLLPSVRDPLTDPYSIPDANRTPAPSEGVAPISPYSMEQDATTASPDDTNHTSNKAPNTTTPVIVGRFPGVTALPIEQPVDESNSSGSPSDDFHNGGLKAGDDSDDGRSWPVFTVALLALFSSLGGNIYLVWLAVSYRERCRRMIAKSRPGTNDDLTDEYDFQFEETLERPDGASVL